MKYTLVALSIGLLFILLSAVQPCAQTTADPALLAEINRIKAVDNHAHPQRVLRGTEKDDNSTDYLAAEPMDVPVRLRPDNPEYIGAWRALYGYRYADASETHLRELMAAKQRVILKQGDNYATWVLDKLGIETMLANRVAMGRGLVAPRFRWVSYVDAFLYPLNNERASKENPDFRAAYIGLEAILKRYLSESKQSASPTTLDDYLTKVVTATLDRQKREGVIALKFDSAYIRTLNFGLVPHVEASRIYSQHIKGSEPTQSEYKELQDYIFRYIAAEAGRLNLAVHIHVGAGASGYFNQNDASPFLLEHMLNDPKLRQTKFVLVHGGLPNAKEVRFLLYKPNVYADFSAQAFLTSKRELSGVIRSWLEFVPEKVLFGTDAFPITPEVGWEEIGWLTTTSAREALALALTGMIKDGQITRKRALELARMVMRDNAVKLYGWKDH
ncbi:MAG: amidohydrolase [Acidobacteria bacterium]|nr:amidohydrolase [Acidobacteriota bacterium]